jgi:hypothetical protein
MGAFWGVGAQQNERKHLIGHVKVRCF